MKKLFTLAVTTSIITLVSNQISFAERNKIKDDINDFPYYNEIPSGHIYYGEVIDTLIKFKRDTVLDFQWVFRQLYPIQHIGRENHPYGDAYIEKLLQYFPLCEGDGRYINCDSVNNYLKDIPHDTIFLKETISRDNSYRIYFWHRLDSVYTVGMRRIGEIRIPRYRVFSLNFERDSTYIYINSWRKKELKELGKHEISPNVKYDSNPHSICATRIILTPDSVFMDMFKFYEPYALEE